MKKLTRISVLILLACVLSVLFGAAIADEGDVGNQGSVTLYKVDADDNSKKLERAIYKLFALVDGRRMYVTGYHEDGELAAPPILSEEFIEGADFPTDEYGQFIVRNLEAGLDIWAEEIQAPADYFVNPEPVHIGTVVSGQNISVIAKDLLYPTLAVQVIAVDQAGNDSTYQLANGQSATFRVYVKDKSGSFLPVTSMEREEEPLELTAENGEGFTSAPARLKTYGEYYLLETGAGAGLLLPWMQLAAGQNFEVAEDGRIFFGPYTVAPTADGTSTKTVVQARNVINSARLSLNVYDKKRSTENSKWPIFSGFRYCVMAELPVGDAETAALLPGTWTGDCPVKDIDTANKPGYQWYYSEILEYDFTNAPGVPLKDVNGEEINYRIIEITAPKFFTNKVNADGSQGHNVVEAKRMHGSTEYIGELYVSPQMIVEVSVRYQKIWDLMIGKDSAYTPLRDAKISLYHVNSDGVIDYCYDTVAMDGSNNPVRFDGVSPDNESYALDCCQRYVIVETFSNGFDVWSRRFTADEMIDRYASGDPIDIDPASLIGSSVSELEQDSRYKITAVVWNREPTGGIGDENYRTCEATLMNYCPYVQIQVPSSGIMFRHVKDVAPNPSEICTEDAPVHGKYVLRGDEYYQVDTESYENLDLCKFSMSAVNLTAYNDNPDDLEGMFNSGEKDDYVYETGSYSAGSFVTNGLDYCANKVYIFKEIKAAPDGWQITTPYTAVTPEDYINAKNGIYVSDSIANTNWTGEDGGRFERAYRILVDNYMDVGTDENPNAREGEFDPTDKKLAGTTFKVELLDRNLKPMTVSGMKSSAFFTTGFDHSNPSRGISETLYIDQDSIIGFADAGNNPDDVFTFLYGSEKTILGYAEFKQAYDNIGKVECPYELNRFQLCFSMLITEIKWPDNVTPYSVERLLTVETVGDGAYSIVENRECTDDADIGNPFLNIADGYVLMQPQKKVGSDLWTTDDANDYVEFVIDRADGETPEQANSKVRTPITVRIDGNNCHMLPVLRLDPLTEYVMTETHAPKGCNKPPDAECLVRTFMTGTVEDTRSSDDPDIRVQKFEISDSPYVTYTVTMMYDENNPNPGARLQIRYSPENGYSDEKRILDANGNPLDELEYDGKAMSYSVVTDENGVARFTVPKYDYRKKIKLSNGAFYSDKTARYIISEIDESGNDDPAFNIVNTTTEREATGDQHIVVGNMCPGTLKFSLNDSNGSAISGVSFDLEYQPFTSSDQIFNYPSLPTGYNTKMTQETDAGGEISLTGLNSGFYRLTEHIPAGYVYGGGTAGVCSAYTVEFVYVTPTDVKLLKMIHGDNEVNSMYWKGNSITVFNKAVKNYSGESVVEDEFRSYNSFMPGSDTAISSVTITNTPMARLVIDKTFVAIDDDFGLQTPENISFVVYKKNNHSYATCSELYVLETMNGQTTQRRLGNNDLTNVDVDANNYASTTVELKYSDTDTGYILVEPGVYRFYEKFPTTNAYYATATSGTTALTATEPTKSSISGYTYTYVQEIELSASNGDTNPVTVSFTNRTAWTGLKVKKVDDSNPARAIANAEFIIYEGAKGSEKYYVGQDTNGLGKWSANESDAVRFMTDSDGILDARFILTADQIKANANAFSIRETRVVDDFCRDLIDDVTYTGFVRGELMDISDDVSQYLVDGIGCSIDFTQFGSTITEKDADTPKLSGASFKLYKMSDTGTEPVVTFDDDGHPMISSTTDSNGNGCFHYLDRLEPGESYVLVPINKLDDYLDAAVYGEATESSKLAKATVDGETYQGYVVVFPNGSRTAHIDVFAMPFNRLPIEINENTFPDATFRAYVAENFDTDSNGALSDEERLAVDTINVTRTYDSAIGGYAFDAIESLKGLEAFPLLRNLYCATNELTSLDLSGCPKLECLNAYNNRLTALNISGCAELRELTCNANAFSSLDVSGYTNLITLVCNANSLAELNVNGCASLKTLNCAANRMLTELDLTGCAALETLECGGDALTALDLSGCETLKVLNCGFNAIAALDVSACASLESLICDNNAITALNVSGFDTLTELHCISNAISELDVTGCTALQSLNCFGNALTKLNVGDCAALLREPACSGQNVVFPAKYISGSTVYTVGEGFDGVRFSGGAYDAETGTVTFTDRVEEFSYEYPIGYKQARMRVNVTHEHDKVYAKPAPATHGENGTVGAFTCGICGETGGGEAISKNAVFTLPAYLTSVEAEAFTGLPMQQVTVPAGTEIIKANAFADCLGLTLVIFEGDTEIENGAFGSDVVFICAEETAPAAYAEANGITWFDID